MENRYDRKKSIFYSLIIGKFQWTHCSQFQDRSVRVPVDRPSSSSLTNRQCGKVSGNLAALPFSSTQLSPRLAVHCCRDSPCRDSTNLAAMQSVERSLSVLENPKQRWKHAHNTNRFILNLTLCQIAIGISELDLLVGIPCDASFLHFDLTMTVRSQRQCVVEQRICDRTARNNRLTITILIERSTICRDRIFKVAQQLIIVTRFYISSMILIEIRQSIVEENVALEGLVKCERDSALAGRVGIVNRSAKILGAGDVELTVVLELFALCVVDDMLGNLKTTRISWVPLWLYLLTFPISCEDDDSPD